MGLGPIPNNLIKYLINLYVKFLGNLKARAQTNSELNIRPRRRQVEERADHAPVLLLVPWFSFLVSVQSRSRTKQKLLIKSI